MNIWPQRERFKKLVLDYRKRHDINREEMAERLGVKESHLHGLLYDRRVRPSLEVVQKAAELFEVSITDLVDDPGSAPPGIPQEKWADATERDRVIATAMFADITADQLAEAEKDELFSAYKEAKERILRLRKLQGSGPA